MKEPNAHIEIDGHGKRPSTPKPLPTFAQPPRTLDAEWTRGARAKPSTRKPSPTPPVSRGNR